MAWSGAFDDDELEELALQEEDDDEFLDSHYLSRPHLPPQPPPQRAAAPQAARLPPPTTTAQGRCSPSVYPLWSAEIQSHCKLKLDSDFRVCARAAGRGHGVSAAWAQPRDFEMHKTQANYCRGHTR